MSLTKNLFGQKNPPIYLDIFSYISRFLSLEDRAKSAGVNRAWNAAVKKDPQWYLFGVGGKEDFNIRFNKLHPEIKKLVRWGACELVTAEKISNVWSNHQDYINHLPQSLKTQIQDPTYPHQHICATHHGFALLMCGLIDVQEARTIPVDVLNVFLNNWSGYNNNTLAIYAIAKKLITLKQAGTMSVNHLNILLNQHGVKAIEAGLIRVADAQGASIDVLSLFLSDHLNNYYSNPNRARNMQLLTDKVLTFKDAKEMPIESLRVLLTDLGTQMLVTKQVNVEQLKAMPTSGYVAGLLTAWGNFALDNSLISPEQIRLMPNELYVSALLTKWGCIALRDGLVSVDQIMTLPDANFVNALMSQWGVEALRMNLISFEQILGLANSAYASALFTQWGVQALSEGLITMDFVNSIPYPEFLAVLMRANGLEALRQGWITLDHICDANINLETLSYFLGAGFFALEKGLVKFEQHIHSDVYSVMAKVQSVKSAVDNIGHYKTMLNAMNSKRISKNNIGLGIEKVKLLERFFHNNSLNINEDMLTKILEDRQDSLLVNRSKFPFKFFKIKSFMHGHKNPLLNNRYCESETEVRLVEVYKACQAAQAA